jgi:hypothetical protein
MSAPRRTLWLGVVSIGLLGGSAGSAWQLSAQARATAQRTDGAALPRAQRPVVTNGQRGATYDWLESKATRVITRFTGGTAIAERTADGRVVARVTDQAGNEVATLRANHGAEANDALEFTAADGTMTRFTRRADVRATLDWGSQQAYSLWKDRGAVRGAVLEWQDTLLRPRGAGWRDAANESVQTDTEWVGGFSATVTRKMGRHVSYQTGREITGPVLISAFKQDGVEVGASQWWPQEQTFAWSFPGLTDGYIDASRLQRDGGWGFVPDMAWLNTQNLAFLQFHTLLKTRGSVSERRGGWLDRLGTLLSPKLFANEPGCDGLHWLDSTIFRPCCDSHDQCYAKADPACGSSSWWRWWTSWQCDTCNIYVTYCFLSGGGHVFHRFP